MAHGINPQTGEVCDKSYWTKVNVNGVPLRAVAGCICGWAVFEGVDEYSVVLNELAYQNSWVPRG